MNANVPVKNEMKSRWNELDTFEQWASIPSIVIDSKFQVLWGIKKQQDPSFVEQHIGSFLIHSYSTRRCCNQYNANFSETFFLNLYALSCFSHLLSGWLKQLIEHPVKLVLIPANVLGRVLGKVCCLVSEDWYSWLNNCKRNQMMRSIRQLTFQQTDCTWVAARF
jgi:hypothetical protein